MDDSSLLVSYTASVVRHGRIYLKLNFSNRSFITMFSRTYYSNHMYCRIIFPPMPNVSERFFFIQASLPKPMCYSFLLSTAVQTPTTGYRSSFPGIRRPGCEINHLLPASSEVKNEWNYTSAVQGKLYTLGTV